MQNSANDMIVDQGRPRPQHPAITAPAHRFRRLATPGQNQQGAEGKPARWHKWLERAWDRPYRGLLPQLPGWSDGAVWWSFVDELQGLVVWSCIQFDLPNWEPVKYEQSRDGLHERAFFGIVQTHKVFKLGYSM